MAFLKFNVADNAVGNLDADILASTTTITLETGDGAVFPSTNFIATLVQYDTPTDPTTDVVKREKVLVSSRSGDIFTCTRWYDGDSATTFSTGDYVYLNVVSKVIEDIQDEVEQVRTDLEADVSDLETNKLDVVWETRTGLTANKLLKTDASGVEWYLSFGASGTVLTGAGTTTEPTWSAPTVSITWLTAETTPTTSDLAIIYDDSASTNKKTTLANLTKGLSTATTSVKGTVEMATDAEALAGTDEERYVNPKQLQDNIPEIVKNWTRTTLTQSAWTSTENTSATITITTMTVAKWEYSVYDATDSYVKLQKNNWSWADIYSNIENESGDFIFILDEWEYRIACKNNSGTWWLSTWTLYYTT